MRTFLEFFAGGGMVRAGLGPSWQCLFANDLDARKSRIYREELMGQELRVADVGSLELADVPGQARPTWASFRARTSRSPATARA